MYLSESLYLRLVDYTGDVCDDENLDFNEIMTKIDSLLYSDDNITNIYERLQDKQDTISCIFKNFYEWNC